MRAPTLAVIAMFGLAVNGTAEAIHDFSDYTEPSLIAQHDFGDIHPDHNLVDGPRAQPVHKHVLSNHSTGNLLNITTGSPSLPLKNLLELSTDISVDQWTQLQSQVLGIVTGIFSKQGTASRSITRQKLHDDLKISNLGKMSNYNEPVKNPCKYPDMVVHRELAAAVNSQFIDFIFDVFELDKEKVSERHLICDNIALMESFVNEFVKQVFEVNELNKELHLSYIMDYVLDKVSDKSLKRRLGRNMLKHSDEFENVFTKKEQSKVVKYFLDA